MTIQELTERLEALVQKRTESQEAMEAIYDNALKDSRDLTEEEETKWQELGGEIEKSKAEEARVAEMITNRKDVEAPAQTFTNAIHTTPRPEEFRSFGEFIYSVRFDPSDPRLEWQDRVNESREMSMGAGVEGGFAIPTQFVPTLLQVTPDVAAVRPRARVIPAGTPPDSAITMPALNQTNAENMYGGVEVNWIAEGGTKPETDARLLEITLTPHEVAGYTVLSDKLLRNWQAADALMTSLLRGAIVAAEENRFLTGQGVGSPLGITNSPCTITVTRNTANAIDYMNDIVSMFARIKTGGSLVWVGSPTIRPELMSMTDGTNLVWSNGGNWGAAVPAPPGTLCGIPVVFNDRMPPLGTTGDLILADMQYYLIKDGSGPFVATSPHVHFTSNKTVIKAFWNVDGQPWLSAPLPLEGSTPDTVSPFVILGAA
jgi:HK97 family phage major capsid protein